MELTSEDALRLNVLLASKPLAIRIHESSMTVFGLTENGEAQVKLNPNCRDEQYVKKVRELLSSHISGSPGGYPVFIQRWTRMGQMRDENLEQLLMLGEPEAVVAAVCSPGLTNELARRAWWAMDDAENARRMLEHQAVVTGDMGPVLAEYLIEHLPFETEPEKIIQTVQRVLQPGLINQKTRLELWKKGLRKGAYHVGFVLAAPDDIPLESSAHPLHETTEADLETLCRQGNPYAVLTKKIFSPRGQAFLQALKLILKKPANQEVVNLTLDAIRFYFSDFRPEGDPDLTLEDLRQEARVFLEKNHAVLQPLLDLDNRMEAILCSARVLSGMGYGVLRPVFHDTTAIGSLMRRKLEPVFSLLNEDIARLC